MKRFIKYSIVLLVVIITTYLMINVSKVLAIGLTQKYHADRKEYTGELYFDSLVWSSAMFCNQHGGPYFNKADTQITVSGTVGGKSVSVDVTGGDTYTLRSESHPSCFSASSDLKIDAVSYSGKGLLGGECSTSAVSVAGTVYATGKIQYNEGGGISASNDEVAYLLAEAGANTPGIVPKASYPNHAWWRRTEAAAAANSGAQSAFPDDPTLNDEQEREAKDAITKDNRTQIEKLENEKAKLEGKIEKWQKIINKYETKIDGYEEIIASLNSEISDNNKAIRKKRQQRNSYKQKLDDATAQLNAKKAERDRLQAKGQNTQKVNQEISKLNSRIIAYNDAINGLNNDIAILTNENNALQSQVNRYQKLINAIQNPDVNNKKQYNSSIPRYQKYIKKARKRINVINAEIAQLQAEITELNKQFEDRLKDRERFMQYLDSVAIRKNVDSDGYSAGNADGLIAEARLFATMHKAIKSYGKNGKNGVYQDTIKDLTNKANVQVTYDATRKRYLVGPFRFQYMEVYSSTSYGDSESGNQGNQFAGITGVPELSVQIYKDGRNQVEDWKLGEGWTFSWEGNERSNIDSLGGSIPDQYDAYPHTGEEFYILMDYKEGMHKLGGLTFDFRCLTANGTYHYSSGYIEKWSWEAGSVSYTTCNHEYIHYQTDENGNYVLDANGNYIQGNSTYCSDKTEAKITVSKKKVGTIATQQLMRVEYAHRYFDEIKAGYGFTPDGNLGNDKGRAKFRWNIDLTTTLAGDVWVDEDSQKDDKSYTIGVKEGGEKNLKNVGVTIYIYSGSRNVRKAIAHKSNGEEIKWPIYTNSAGHYEVKRLEAPGSVKNGFYVIEFEYDGQVYRQTTYLGKSNSTTTSDGETYANQGTASAYKQNPDAYSNSSMAVEQVDTRYIFDQTFGEITGTKSIEDDNSTVGKTKTTDSAGNNATDNADAKFNKIDYRGKTIKVGEDGTQVVSTLNSAASPKDGGGNQKVTEGETYDRYRMTAKTYYDNTELHEMAVNKTNFRIKYPLVEETDANGKAQDWIYVMNRFRIKNAKGKEVGRYIDNYMLHINLGLKERPKTDMSTIKDLYKITMIVNEQKITKQYNLLGDFDSSEYELALEKRQNEWEGKKYTKYSLGLYSTDLAYQSYQRYRNAIPEVREMKKGTELRVFVTYVVRVYNNSDTNDVEFNEITDYYDETYTIVSEDVKSSIVDNNSKRSEQVVADAPYYRIMNTKDAEVNNLWKETKEQNLEGKVDGVDCGAIKWNKKKDNSLKENQKMLKSTTDSLTQVKVKPNQYAEIFTTYQVDEEGYEKMKNDTATIQDRKLIIGDKENVAEISNYSTYYSTKDYNTSYYKAYRNGWISGRVDKDSAPNNIKRSDIKDRTRYEDDTDRAIPINIKLETYERDMYGYVWEDKKETDAGGSKIKVGNGYYDNGEELIPNVGITMYEVINMGRLNSDGTYNTEYDNYDYYYQIPQDYYNYNNPGNSAYTIEGGKANTAAVETTKPSTKSSNPKPNYYIYGFLPGDYILRFDYGTKGDGNTDIKYSTNQNAESQQSSINIVKYNGQDYENTKFLGDLSEKSGEEHLNDKYLDLTGKTKINGTDISDLKISTARDNESRRMIVDAYSRTIENDRGQILRERDTSNTEFINSTKMYSETPIMQIEIEDPKKMKIEGQSDESQQSSDQQLRVRGNGEKYEPDAKKNQAEQDESIENHKYSIKNINFGLEERAKTDIALEKYIENIQLLKADEVILNASMTEDGEIIKTDVNATGLDKIAYLPHSKASTAGLYQQGFYALSVEDDYLNDIALRIEYKIKLINNSEADYTGKLAELYKADDIINKANEYNEYRGSMTGKTEPQYNTSTIKPQIIDYGIYVGRFYYENRIKTEPAAYKIKYYADNNSSLEDMAISYDADKIVTTTVDQLVDYVDVDASLENDSSIANAAWATSELEPESEITTGGYNKSLNGLIDKTAYRVVNNKLNIFDEKNREFINTTRSNIAISYNERLGKLEEIPTPDGGTENCGDKGRVEYAEPDKARSKYNSTLTKELKPKNCFPEGSDSNEYYSEIHITVRKEATSGDEANQMRIDNLAEVLVYSNTTGRRDINSVPGNAMTISTTQGMWNAGYNSIDLHKSQAQENWETESKNWTKYPENDAWSPEYVTVIAPTGIALRTYIKNNIIPITILLLAIGVMGIAFIVKQKKIQKNDEE